MKIYEQRKAKYLRKKYGMSIGNISEKLSVAKSSVSLWVRDIELSKKQKHRLYASERGGLEKATISHSKKCRDKRISYQKCGRRMAKKYGHEFSNACALYWAEGWKRNNKTMVSFANSDPRMIEVFASFLRKYFNVKNEKIKLSINCYTGNGLTIKEIENYWIDLLNLDIKENLWKTQVDYYPFSPDKKKNIIPYGTCQIKVCSVEIIQKIYGATQEIFKFNEPSWLG